MIASLVKILVIFSTLSNMLIKNVEATKRDCFVCKTYQTDSNGHLCLSEDPKSITECVSTSYGDCLINRVTQILSNDQTNVEGEKGCVYPSHLKCLEKATGVKLPLGKCHKVYMSQYAFKIWVKCFEDTVLESSKAGRHNLRKRTLDDTPTVFKSKTRREAKSPELKDSQSTKAANVSVTGRYFEYCLCKGKLCNQKDKLVLSDGTEMTDDEKASAVAISAQFSLYLLIFQIFRVVIRVF